MVKNIRPWALNEFGPTYRLCFRAGCYMPFLAHHCCFSCSHTWNGVAGAPCAPLPEVLETTSAGLVSPLESFRNMSYMRMSARHLFWQETNCLFLPPLASVPVSGICAHLPSFTHSDKEVISFLKPSFLLLKILEFSLHSPVGSVVLLCFMYFKLLLFSCVIFLLHFSPLVLLFSFGVLLSSVFTTFDYKRTPLKSSKNNYRS